MHTSHTPPKPCLFYEPPFKFAPRSRVPILKQHCLVLSGIYSRDRTAFSGVHRPSLARTSWGGRLGASNQGLGCRATPTLAAKRPTVYEPPDVYRFHHCSSLVAQHLLLVHRLAAAAMAASEAESYRPPQTTRLCILYASQTGTAQVYKVFFLQDCGMASAGLSAGCGRAYWSRGWPKRLLSRCELDG